MTNERVVVDNEKHSLVRCLFVYLSDKILTDTVRRAVRLR